MIDENFEEIIPLRIAYQPGVVLEVVEGNGQVHSTTGEFATLARIPVAAGGEPGHHHNTRLGSHLPFAEYTTTAGFNTLTQTVAALAVADINNTSNQSLVMSSAGIPEDTQPFQLTYNQMQQLVQMQHIQQQTIIKNQEEMLRMQKNALDRLAIIQNSVQALLTQTYELHEYPIPRLFIVLPKNPGFLEKLNPTSVPYRLYFLCECGTHTMAEHSKTPPDIHLAKHEGYDLNKPTEFFERYGSYILALLYMVKFGVAAAGIAVPPLASLKIFEGLDTAQEHVKDLKSSINSLVDNTIKALEDFKNIGETNSGLGTEYTDFDKLEALEGADLRQLESFLKVKDERRVLGNLYRIVTPEGHVKWVCLDHYRTNYRESVIKQLREVVETNGGTFIEETGSIEIKVGSSILARQFYDVMVRARGIQELEITLEWDATMNDLRSLSEAVTKGNVIRLTVHGTHFKSSALDAINRGRRFDPILQLTSNTRIQSLQLQGFDNFFSRITKSIPAPSSKLRVFSVQSGIPFKDMTKFFNSHMEQFSLLTALELVLHQPHSIAKVAQDILNKFNKLESLKIDCGDNSVTTRALEGKIQEVKATISRLDDLSPDDLKFIQDGHLAHLAIQHAIEEADESRLADVLRRTHSLKHLQIGCKAERFLAITNVVISTRATMVQERGSSCLQTIELMEEKLTPFDILGECDSDKTYMQSVLTFKEDSDSFDMRTWIRLQNNMSITESNPVNDFIRQYGWSIVLFDEDWTKNSTFAAILDDIPTTRDSQLESLRFHTNRFKTDGFERLDSIIERSPNLKDLGLIVLCNYESDFEKAQSLFIRYGSILSMLQLRCNSLEDWLPRIASSFPTRNCFPNMVSLGLWGRSHLLSDLTSCIPWIEAMVSAPPQATASSMHSPSLSQGIVDIHNDREESESTGSWTASLGKIMLRWVKLQPEEWKTVIKAMDLSKLRHLDFSKSDITHESFKLLVDRIPDNYTSKVSSFKTLDIRDTGIAKSPDSRVILNELWKKVPLLEIIGIS
ncbi:hypothetical protein BGZ65_003805 [Modicella reniformis]|uniref:Uncharacterized protein n=1 Tax=Modicella reniformis TaxID=1440133 RepID=A0A9P6IZL6_9FUNG|nr:hypothetical protein BGZ65_003805 [Modicella reniformis]